MKLTYCSISCAPHLAGTSWLLLDSEPFDEWVDELEASNVDGRQGAPRRVTGTAELEGAGRDYGRDEIRRSIDQSQPLPWESAPQGCVVVPTAFVAALEAEEARFRALPLEIVHGASGRTWTDHWFVFFPERRPLRLLKDDSIPVLRPGPNDDLMSTLYSPRVVQRLEALALPHVSFHRHELEACDSVPLPSGDAGDEQLRLSAAAAFLAKKPRAQIGSAYGTDWLLELLLMKYSDVTEARLVQALSAPESDLFVKLENGRLDAVGVRAGTRTAGLIEKRSRT
ncbi:MAG: hypothetical protein GQE15_12600 [Archangiaceae bacterium]|nr:hypothetical protein [Archangiaceae bacterium]